MEGFRWNCQWRCQWCCQSRCQSCFDAAVDDAGGAAGDVTEGVWFNSLSNVMRRTRSDLVTVLLRNDSIFYWWNRLLVGLWCRGGFPMKVSSVE